MLLEIGLIFSDFLQNLVEVHLSGNSDLCGPPPEWTLLKEVHYENTKISVSNSEISLDCCTYLFWVVSVVEFEKLDRFYTHEQAQEIPGLLLLLVVERGQFKKWRVVGTNIEIERYMILFISHKWLEEKHPDDAEKTKMKQIKKLLKKPEFKAVKYMWLDYFCIPQDTSKPKRKERQQRAINSIAYYVKSCQYFVTLFGNNEPATLEIYNGRGWCRFERFISIMCCKEYQSFFHNKDDDKLLPYNEVTLYCVNHTYVILI